MAVIKQFLSFGLLALLVGTTISNDTAVTTKATTTPLTITTSATTLTPATDKTTGTTLTPATETTAATTLTPATDKTTGTTLTPATTVTDGSTTASSTLTPATTVTGGSTTASPTLTPATTVTDGSTISTTLTPDTTPSTTLAPGPCASSPCPLDSTCQELLSNYTCLCRPGLFYDETQKSCNLAKTFPSDLTIQKEFEEEMGNKDSEQFKQIAADIVKSLADVFKDKEGYLGSTVLKLEKGSIIADVQNFFSVKSGVDEAYVESKLKQAAAIPDQILFGATITVKDVCGIDYCDAQSTDCKNTNGIATCTCAKGYIQLTATQQACIPCPSGEQAVDSKTCKPCSFGYSGFNCQESYLLILVVVACVLGALLLGTLIGIAVMFSRSKKTSKNSEKNTPGGTLEFNKPVGITRIPRANPNPASQQNNLEMTDSGSRYALVSSMWESDYNDDAKSSRNQAPSRTGYGARPSRNPYADVYEDRNQRF